MRRAVAAAALAAGAAAWPSWLGCADDAASRLKAGKIVMGGPVLPCADPCPVTISAAAGPAAGTTLLTVTTTVFDDLNTKGVNFAVRVNDGAGSLSSPDANLTSVCPRQLITVDPKGIMGEGGAPPGSFAIIFTPAEGKTFADAVVTVGFASMPWLPPAAGIYVVTYPPTPPPPPPAPAPAGTPVMRLLDAAACDGVAPTSKVDEDGVFTLSVSVVGEQGFAYNCSAVYDPAVGVAEGDCAGWLPAAVLDAKEPLAITLRAVDSAARLAVCMQWELAFSGGGSGAAGRRPPRAPVALDPSARRPRGARGGSAPGNNTEASRVEAMGYYLDSMTHMSHRCVPRGQPAYLAGLPSIPFFPKLQVPGFAWPPSAHTPTQLRVSHALLAVTGTVWSIDRSCYDAWDMEGKGTGLPGSWHESCAPPALTLGKAHCHENCAMTWRLGPGGVASWGIWSLSHHIPSPGIALVGHMTIDEAVYGDMGCGDPARRG